MLGGAWPGVDGWAGESWRVGQQYLANAFDGLLAVGHRGVTVGEDGDGEADVSSFEACDLVEEALGWQCAGLEEDLPARTCDGRHSPALLGLDGCHELALVGVETWRCELFKLSEEARLIGGGGLRVGPPPDTGGVVAHAGFARDTLDGALSDDAQHG